MRICFALGNSLNARHMHGACQQFAAVVLCAAFSKSKDARDDRLPVLVTRYVVIKSCEPWDDCGSRGYLKACVRPLINENRSMFGIYLLPS